MSEVVTEDVPRLRLGAFRLTPTQIRRVRKLPLILVGLVITLAVVWVLFLADRTWTADTSAGAAIDEPGEFVVTLLDGLTFAGLLFVVASGFTLIFGLMRTVNMAHGAFFLLAAYIAIELQQTMVGKTSNIEPGDVSMRPVDRPAPRRSARGRRRLGVVMQQVFLRWNQGQDLRQALITIAVDGHPRRPDAGPVRRPRQEDGVARRCHALHRDLRSALRHRAGCSCSPSRVVVGIVLWLWLNRTRMGMVIRAGVDDKDDGPGARHQRRRRVRHHVLRRRVPRRNGRRRWGPRSPEWRSGTDGQWLLNSLIVVIIGGLGSVKGAVAGSLLYGMVTAFSPAYLPSDYTFYSIIFTFVILAVVLAVRPNGLFGRQASRVTGVDDALTTPRRRSVSARSAAVAVACAFMLLLPRSARTSSSTSS